MIEAFFISFLVAFGIAVLLVEKSDDGPLFSIKMFITNILFQIHRDLPDMLECTICTCFWTALIADICLFFITCYSYFMWPLSGFAFSGITWVIYQFMNILDKTE